MSDRCVVVFKPSGRVAEAPRGANLLDLVHKTDIDLLAPCGGYGRCGRCKVLVEQGKVNRRASHSLSPAEVAQGFAPACQTAVESGRVVFVQPREVVKARPPEEVAAEAIALPAHCVGQGKSAIRKLFVAIDPPSLADNTNDLDRLRRELARQHRVDRVHVALPVLATLGRTLREAARQVTVVLQLPNEAIGGGGLPEVIG